MGGAGLAGAGIAGTGVAGSGVTGTGVAGTGVAGARGGPLAMASAIVRLVAQELARGAVRLLVAVAAAVWPAAQEPVWGAVEPGDARTDLLSFALPLPM